MMELILWRHADAEDYAQGGDAARALTKKGRRQAERMAEWLRPLVGAEWRILVSPARRALETVEPLDRSYEECVEVGLAATPESLLEAAEWPTSGRPVMVVGHQPTLGQVIARLIGDREGDVSVRKGAVWWFQVRQRGQEDPEVVLKCVMEPDLLPER
jgi:phosphohistidine phosphatase